MLEVVDPARSRLPTIYPHNGSKKDNMAIKLKAIHAFEQLAEIEAAEGEQKIALLKQYGAKAPLNFLLSLNYNKKVVLDLPEGMPPIEPRHLDSHTHPDFMGQLGSQLNRLKNLRVEAKVPKYRKEQIFYEILINCPLKDAEILCSAKDRALEELYPTVTADFVKSVFPLYVQEKEETNDAGKKD